MSFRGRLRLFFVLLVIVPMIALAVVLFTLTSRSETGKADAGISAGVRTAFGVYEEAAARAEPALREVGSDRRLRAALASGRGVEARLEQLVTAGSTAPDLADGSSGADPSGDIVRIELYSTDRELIARAGSPAGVAPRGAPSQPAARHSASSPSRSPPRTHSPHASRLSPTSTPPCTAITGFSPPPQKASRIAPGSAASEIRTR